MNFFLFPILLITLHIASTNGFNQFINQRRVSSASLRLTNNNKVFSTVPSPVSTTQLNAQFNDVINPSKFDSKRIVYTLAGQAVLTLAAFGLGSAFNIDVLHLENLQTETTILQETVIPALGIFFAIFSFSFLLKDVQLNGLQEFFRERKFYVLKTLGLQTDPVLAVFIALIIALGEGFSDEIFFRGFAFSSIHLQFGDQIAIAFSALISGLAHIPIFGSNFFVESLLSMIYGISFLASGFNIIVPMTIHAIYSLVSMYITWYFSTTEIRKRIETARSVSNAESGDTKLEAMARAVSSSSSSSTLTMLLSILILYCYCVGTHSFTYALMTNVYVYDFLTLLSPSLLLLLLSLLLLLLSDIRHH